jgi:hypothetical protein
MTPADPKATAPSAGSELRALLQNLGTLALLLLMLPLNLVLVLTALLWHGLTTAVRERPAANANADSKSVLLTGGKMTKALQLARSFKAAGHRVFLVETPKYWLSGHRFSNAVDGFFTVPVPQDDPDGYARALLAIVERERIDAFVPVSSPIASYYDGLAKPLLALRCDVIHCDAETTRLLDSKYSFCRKAHELGLSAPKVFLITDPQQVLDFDFEQDGSQYLLKSITYDSVTRLDMTRLPFDGMERFVQGLPISEDRPWVMQEFITGQEYCTHSTVRDGVIRLHCCSRSSPFQVNYDQVENPAIDQWVRTFVQGMGLTGQVSIDFIQAADGSVYPIECNPRTHSAITMFHNHPGVADAYLGRDPLPSPWLPLPDSRPTYWLYHELWRLTGVRSLADLRYRIGILARGTDAILDRHDPLPFLMVHHWQIPLLLLGNLRKLKGWVRIDFNIGKLVETGGD